MCGLPWWLTLPASGCTEGGERAVLYYDGACPLCTAEMDRLGELAGDGLQLADIHELPESEALPERETLLEVLHYRTAEGEWVTGLEANVAAWQHTRWGWAWRLLLLPGVRQVAGWCYGLWARWRYERLYQRSPSKR